MRRPLIALLGILACCFFVPISSDGATLALYDDFSASQIDAAKWQEREFVREIRGGKLVSILRTATYPHNVSNSIGLANPASIHSHRADVRLNAYTLPPGGGQARVRLQGAYYSDGTIGAGQTGDIVAQVFLEGTGSGVNIRYSVFRCSDSTCSTGTDVVPTTTVKAAALGETHTLGIAWSAGVFTFSVDGVDTIVNPADCSTYPTCQRVVSATPNVPYRSLSTRLGIVAPGGEGYVAGDFDNVYVNDTLYDTFEGAPFSGPHLLPAKWANLEFVLEPQGGRLVTRAATAGPAGDVVRSRLRPVNRNVVTSMQTSVTVTEFQSSSGGSVHVQLAGGFYNDGSSTGGGDYTGDIEGWMRIISQNGGPLTAQFYSARCSDSQCNTNTVLNNYFDSFGTVNPGETHTLFLQWDGSVITYGMDGTLRTFDPKPFFAVSKPPVQHNRQPIYTRAQFNSGTAPSYIAATYDNVYVNSNAVTPPRLAPFLQQTVTGDVVSAGVGLRGTGTGTITLTGIPEGATVQKAYLYWATLGTSGTFTTPTVNGTAVSGTLIGQSDDPWWGSFQSYAYRADVTSRVTGNGSYTIAGLPHAGPSVNDSQGASLVVLYTLPGVPARRIVINDGAVMLSSAIQYYATPFTGFTAPSPPTGATLTFLVGDGQTFTPEYAGLNTTLLATNEFNGSNGNYWDTRRYDVSSAIPGGATSASAVLSTGDDALVWVAAILSVPVFPPPVIASVTATPASPQVLGTPITVTATVTGGAAPYQCKWLVTTDPTWATYSRLRDWGACSVPWTPTVAGSYALGVWVRNNGTTADTWEASQSLSFTITAPPPPTVTSLTANLTSPRPVGTALTLTASVTGGTAPQQCKWLVTTDPTWATYSVLQTWQACTTPVPWTPTVPASYQVGVWARSSGTTADTPQASAGLSFTITAPPPPTVTSLTANLTSPRPVGTALTLTASVTGGTAPQQCKWLVTTDPTWATYSVLQTWQACTTPVPWTPTVPASYQVGVWARSSGTTADTPQASAGLSFTITAPPPPTVTSLTANLTSPRPVGTALTLTASVTGGTAPQQCKWLVTTDPTWATYSVLQTWQACTTPVPWTPTVPASYQVGVWARSSGTTADTPQASAGLSFTITAPPPPTVTSLTANLTSPRPVGTALTLTASVTGGTAPQQCKWLVTTDPTWATYSVLQTWQACTTPVPWTPTVPASYQVGVWARSSGTTADTPRGQRGAQLHHHGPTPAHRHRLTANLTSPRPVGTPSP